MLGAVILAAVQGKHLRARRTVSRYPLIRCGVRGSENRTACRASHSRGGGEPAPSGLNSRHGRGPGSHPSRTVQVRVVDGIGEPTSSSVEPVQSPILVHRKNSSALNWKPQVIPNALRSYDTKASGRHMLLARAFAIEGRRRTRRAARSTTVNRDRNPVVHLAADRRSHQRTPTESTEFLTRFRP